MTTIFASKNNKKSPPLPQRARRVIGAHARVGGHRFLARKRDAAAIAAAATAATAATADCKLFEHRFVVVVLVNVAIDERILIERRTRTNKLEKTLCKLIDARSSSHHCLRLQHLLMRRRQLLQLLLRVHAAAALPTLVFVPPKRKRRTKRAAANCAAMRRVVGMPLAVRNELLFGAKALRALLAAVRPAVQVAVIREMPLQILAMRKIQFAAST